MPIIGKLFVLMTWIGEGKSYTIEKGERIAQMVIAPIPPSEFTEVDLESLRRYRTRRRFRLNRTFLESKTENISEAFLMLGVRLRSCPLSLSMSSARQLQQ